jgi:DNA-directed RNA polymerase subunit M/transcription elongation factor TFIIS
MTTLTLWLSTDSCSECGASLVLLEDGASRLVVECRSCGYADVWATDQPTGGDQ